MFYLNVIARQGLIVADCKVAPQDDERSEVQPTVVITRHVLWNQFKISPFAQFTPGHGESAFVCSRYRWITCSRYRVYYVRHVYLGGRRARI